MSFLPFTHHRCAAVRTGTRLLLMVCTVFAVAQAASQADPQPATSHFKQGKLLFQKHDFAGAIESYSKAIELRPAWAEAHLERGLAKRMSGQLAAAIPDFDRATELDSKTTRKNRPVAQAYTNHGQILSQQGQLEEAVTDFDKAIKLSANDLEPYYERGQARLLLEDFEGALADYSSYIAKEEHNDFGRSRALIERGIPRKEIASLLKVPPFVARKLEEQGRELDEEDLEGALAQIQGLESGLKGGSDLSDELQVELTVLGLSEASA